MIAPPSSGPLAPQATEPIDLSPPVSREKDGARIAIAIPIAISIPIPISMAIAISIPISMA